MDNANIFVPNTNKETDGGFCFNEYLPYYDGTKINPVQALVGKRYVYRGVVHPLEDCPETLGKPIIFYYEDNGTKAFILSDGTMCGCWADDKLRVIDTNVKGAIVIGVEIIYVKIDEDYGVCTGKARIATKKGSFGGFEKTVSRLEETTMCAASLDLVDMLAPEWLKTAATGIRIAVKAISGMIFLYISEPCPVAVLFMDNRICTDGWLVVPREYDQFTPGNVHYLEPSNRKHVNHLLVGTAKDTMTFYEIEPRRYMDCQKESVGFLYSIRPTKSTLYSGSHVHCDVSGILYSQEGLVSAKIQEYEIDEPYGILPIPYLVATKIPKDCIESAIFRNDRMKIDFPMKSRDISGVLCCYRTVVPKSIRESSSLNILCETAAKPSSVKGLEGAQAASDDAAHCLTVAIRCTDTEYTYYPTPYGILGCRWFRDSFEFFLRHRSYETVGNRKKPQISRKAKPTTTENRGSSSFKRFCFGGESQDFLVTWRYVAAYSKLDGSVTFYDLSDVAKVLAAERQLTGKSKGMKQAQGSDLSPVVYSTSTHLQNQCNVVLLDRSYSVDCRARDLSHVVPLDNQEEPTVIKIDYYYRSSFSMLFFETFLKLTLEKRCFRLDIVPVSGDTKSQEYRDAITGKTQVPPMEKKDATKVFYHDFFVWFTSIFFTANEDELVVWKSDTEEHVKRFFPKNHIQHRYVFVKFLAKMIAAYFLDVGRELPDGLSQGFLLALVDNHEEYLERVCPENIIQCAEKSGNKRRYLKKAFGLHKREPFEFAECIRDLIKRPFTCNSDTGIFFYGLGCLPKDRLKAALALQTRFKYAPGIVCDRERLERVWPEFVLSLSDDEFRLLNICWDYHNNILLGAEYTLYVCNMTILKSDVGEPKINPENQEASQKYLASKLGSYENRDSPYFPVPYGTPLIKTVPRLFKIRLSSDSDSASPETDKILLQVPYIQGKHRMMSISTEAAGDLEILRRALYDFQEV